MKAKFDLFLRLPDGQPVWIKAVENLPDAQSELIRMSTDAPGDYFIFNAANGQLIPTEAICSSQLSPAGKKES